MSQSPDGDFFDPENSVAYMVTGSSGVTVP